MDNTVEYSHPISVRLPKTLLEQIDEYASEAARRAGVKVVSRTQAIVALLERGIHESTRRKDGKAVGK